MVEVVVVVVVVAVVVAGGGGGGGGGAYACAHITTLVPLVPHAATCSLEPLCIGLELIPILSSITTTSPYKGSGLVYRVIVLTSTPTLCTYLSLGGYQYRGRAPACTAG